MQYFCAGNRCANGMISKVTFSVGLALNGALLTNNVLFCATNDEMNLRSHQVLTQAGEPLMQYNSPYTAG